MAQKLINIRVEVDRETDMEFSEWSEREGRSKRRHVSILMRKLASLRKTHPEDLHRLGLADRQQPAPAAPATVHNPAAFRT